MCSIHVVLRHAADARSDDANHRMLMRDFFEFMNDRINRTGDIGFHGFRARALAVHQFRGIEPVDVGAGFADRGSPAHGEAAAQAASNIPTPRAKSAPKTPAKVSPKPPLVV